MTQRDLRKENWLKVIFYIVQICPCLGFYSGLFISVLYFQILQLKNLDTQNFLLPFTFPITLLSLFDPCKF